MDSTQQEKSAKVSFIAFISKNGIVVSDNELRTVQKRGGYRAC